MKQFASLVAAACFATALGVPPVVAQAGFRDRVASVMTDAGPVHLENVAAGLEHPWGMAFLPDGRLLVTERIGNLRIVDTNGQLSRRLGGTPLVYSQGQGGLLDVALDPEFDENQFVYLSYAEPGPGGSAATALGRGRLEENRIGEFEVLFRQESWVTGPYHFGGSIAFSREGHLFLALGERYQFAPAQDLSNHLGTIVRINRDGSIPHDNPFVGREGAQEAIWSYGHRNIQSAAIDPATGVLWVAEMGPLGGDELNIVEPGRNYGWPFVSWGIHYDGTGYPDPSTRPELVSAIKEWTPTISPSGMVFYSGDVFPEWRGSALIGGLTASGIVRVRSDGQRIAEEELIPLGARIRDVAQGPDGLVYVLTDLRDGKVWRLRPLR